MEVAASDTSRRSTRNRKKPKVDYAIANDESEDHEDSTDKKKKKKPKVIRKKAGKLADLPSLPLDVLFEIFGHLAPYDLLRLSRTTKALRRLLMNRSSRSVWKTSLERIPGLPPCPPDMVEPAWVNLAFSPHCHICYTTHVKNIEWMFRMRICGKCIKEHLKYPFIFRRDDNAEQMTEAQLRFTTLPLSNYIPGLFGSHGTMVFLPSHYAEFKQQYMALTSDEARTAFLDGRERELEERAKHARLCIEWTQTQSLDRDAELRQLKEERKAAIIKKLEDLGWGIDIAGIRDPDYLEDHKHVNKAQRLTEKIWNNIKPSILEFMEKMRAKRLEREFNTLVLKRKGLAMRALQTFKNSRIADDEIMPEGPDYCNFEPIKELLHRPVNEEITVDSFNAITPDLPALIDSWRDSIRKSMIKLVQGEHIKIAEREALLAAERSRYDDWYDPEDPPPLRRPVKPKPLSDEDAEHRLTLATTVFICLTCSKSQIIDNTSYSWDPWEDEEGFGGFGDEDMTYESANDFDDDYFGKTTNLLFFPQAVGHPCLARCEGHFTPERDPSISLRESRSGWGAWIDEAENRAPWRVRRMFINEDSCKIASAFIKLAGQDPMTATVDEMDKADVRFACGVCARFPPGGFGRVARDSSKPSVAPLLSWRAAVVHQKDRHHQFGTTNINIDYVLFKQEDVSDDIKDAERAHKEKNDRVWQCLHCRDTAEEKRPMTLADVKSHLSGRSHEVASPTLNEDYAKHFAALDIESVQKTFVVQLQDRKISVIPKPGPQPAVDV